MHHVLGVHHELFWLDAWMSLLRNDLSLCIVSALTIEAAQVLAEQRHPSIQAATSGTRHLRYPAGCIVLIPLELAQLFAGFCVLVSML